MFKAASCLTIALTVSLFAQTACLAWPSNFSIQSGSGDEITIKKGWFGNEKKVVKDRLGDGFEQSEGLFGNKKTKVNVLGNSYTTKKGIFGTRETEVTSILGDKFKTKKGWFGRSTTVNAGGLTSLVEATIKNKLAGNPLIPQLPTGAPAKLPANQSIDPLQPADSPMNSGVNPGPNAGLNAGLNPGLNAGLNPGVVPADTVPISPAQGLSSQPAQRLERPATPVDPINDNNDVLKFDP